MATWYGPFPLGGGSGSKAPGQDGEPGEDGMPGMPGQPGAAGAPGQTIPGQDGEDGQDGMPGLQGPAGVMGPQGIPGMAWDGEDGDMGPPGVPGATGATGATGAAGSGAGSLGPPGQDGEDADSFQPCIPAVLSNIQITNSTLDNTNTVELLDTSLTLVNAAATTEKVKFNVDNAIAGTITLGLPATAGTLLADIVSATVSNKTLDTTNKVETLPNPNLLIDGDFRLVQKGAGPFTSATTPANSDDTYLFDNWILLSDGNDIVDVSQETATVPQGAYAACALDVETANKKFGILQILEARDAKALIDTANVISCALSFEARVTGTSIANIRAAVLSWSSTADSVTSDVVSTWEAAGTDPVLVANWNYESTPASLAMTTSYVRHEIEGFTIDTASSKNVAVFIWCDDVTTTVGDFLYISKVKLEVTYAPITSFATPWVPTNYGTELAKTLRHFQRIATAGGASVVCPAYATTTDIIRGVIPYYPKRIVPHTLTMSAANTWACEVGGANRLPSVVSASNATVQACRLNLSGLDFAAVTGAGAFIFDNSTVATLDIDARL